jgi:hypothetical protein
VEMAGIWELPSIGKRIGTKEVPNREEEEQQWEMGFLDFLEKQDCESL